MGSTRKTTSSYTSSQESVRVTSLSGGSETNDDLSLRERVARLEADMAWVKKLSVTNVIVSTSTLIGIILSIIILAMGR